jgi:hypothetical protein
MVGVGVFNEKELGRSFAQRKVWEPKIGAKNG